MTTLETEQVDYALGLYCPSCGAHFYRDLGGVGSLDSFVNRSGGHHAVCPDPVDCERAEEERA